MRRRRRGGVGVAMNKENSFDAIRGPMVLTSRQPRWQSPGAGGVLMPKQGQNIKPRTLINYQIEKSQAPQSHENTNTNNTMNYTTTKTKRKTKATTINKFFTASKLKIKTHKQTRTIQRTLQILCTTPRLPTQAQC
jgi:hypothetical protein